MIEDNIITQEQNEKAVLVGLVTRTQDERKLSLIHISEPTRPY